MARANSCGNVIAESESSRSARGRHAGGKPSCPPTANDVGTSGGPFGHASAQANEASGVATAGGTVTDSSGAGGSGAAATGSAGQGQLDRLWSALGAWRSQFLTAADVARYPPARREATSPDGSEERTIVLAVERNTKQLDPVIHDEE